MCQIDTVDPKRKGDPKERVPGSAYDAIDTAVRDVQVCKHLPKVADRLDRMTVVRGLNHKLTDEHGVATNFVYTGRPTSGTISYPSIGSIINHQLGPANKTAPGYVLIGYPSISRGPGFLGSKYGFLYLTDTSKGPAGLSRPHGVNLSREQRRHALLAKVRQEGTADLPAKDPVAGYDDVIRKSHDLARGSFNNAFLLDREPDTLRNAYGSEFGQRCLLARRLVEQGVRFVEVLHNLNFSNGTGWDTHQGGQLNQHVLIKELDDALSALTDDLLAKKMLDKTLIVVATEFGRPPGFDSGGGRGHQGSAFSGILAGGGLNHQGAWGETDELCKKVLKNPVSIPDFHATIHQALGIDSHKELFDGDRPVPITDGGKPIRQLLV
jgi:hypothetical protein